jgi:hypothetical protein
MTFPRDAWVNKCDFPTAVKFLADLVGVASPSKRATGPPACRGVDGKPGRNQFTRDPEQRIAVNTNPIPVSVPRVPLSAPLFPSHSFPVQQKQLVSSTLFQFDRIL